MKLKRYKKCMGLLKKIFLGLLHFSRSLVFTVANVSDHTKCISLSNQLGMAGPTLIYLNPNECNQRLSYYPFMVNLDRCNGICNTINDISRRTCVSNKTEVVNLSAFNIIARINKSSALAKDILSKCKFKYDGTNVTQLRSGISINVIVTAKIQKSMSVKKFYLESCCMNLWKW